MPPLPVVSGERARYAFEYLGWRCVRQSSSHMMLVKPGVPINLSVPDHKELDRGTLRSLLRKADVSVEQFIEALSKV